MSYNKLHPYIGVIDENYETLYEEHESVDVHDELPAIYAHLAEALSIKELQIDALRSFVLPEG